MPSTRPLVPAWRVTSATITAHRLSRLGGYHEYRLKVVGIGSDAGPAWFEAEGNIYGAKVYGAVWNDYAEYRESDCQEAGRVICENGDDTLSLATERLQPGAEIISDTCIKLSQGDKDMYLTNSESSGAKLKAFVKDANTGEPWDAVNEEISSQEESEISETVE